MPKPLLSLLDALQSWSLRSWLARQLPQPSAGPAQAPVEPSKPSTLMDMYPLETCSRDLAYRLFVYLLEALQLLIMLAITITRFGSLLSFKQQGRSWEEELQASSHELYLGLLLLGRIVLALAYAGLSSWRTTPHYLALKLVQHACLLVCRGPLPCSFAIPMVIVCSIEFMADAVYIGCKEQRRGYVDSRLSYGCYLSRMACSSALTLLFNWLDLASHNRTMLLLLLICGVVHCYFVSRDSVYSLLFRNCLLIAWTLAIFNLLYFNFLLFSWQAHRQALAYVLPLVASLGAIVLLFYFKELVVVWHFNQFASLYEEFGSLNDREARNAYVWDAIRLLSISPQSLPLLREAVSRIDWAIQKESKVERSSGHGLYGDFYSRLQRHCYRILLGNFRENPDFKYLLMFFFTATSAEKMLLYFNKSNFFDVRELARIEREHRSSDLASKVNEMLRNEMQISRIIQLYLAKLKELACALGTSSGIDLLVCQTAGHELLTLQEELMKFGCSLEVSIDPTKAEQVENKDLARPNGPQVFSIYTRNLLDLIRVQMLEAPKLSQTQGDENGIAEVVNQQQALVVISAQQDSIGMIVGVNSAALRLTCFSQKELVGQNISILMPANIQAVHTKAMAQKANESKSSDQGYSFKSVVYLVKKSKYCSLCSLEVRFLDGTSGRRWLAKLHQIQPLSPFLICDFDHSIIGFNEAVHQIGLRMDILGMNLSGWLATQLAATFQPATRGVVLRLSEIFQQANGQASALQGYVECSMVSRVDKIMGREFAGYYIVRMVSASEKGSTVKMQNSGSGTEKMKRRNSSRMQKGEQEDKNQSKFKFSVDLALMSYCNWEVQERVVSQRSIPRDGTEEEQAAMVIDVEDINQLIYINGDLEFRENKKLEERHQCDTHPLHANLRAQSGASQQAIYEIEDKGKIYELLGMGSKGQKGERTEAYSFHYLREHKVLLALLVVFGVLCGALSVATILSLKQMGVRQSNKLNTVLLMSERAWLYQSLASSMANYLAVNIQLLMGQEPSSLHLATAADVLGSSQDWLDVVKEVEMKSSLISAIDPTENYWQEADMSREIPELAGGQSLKTQLDITFVDLLKLDQLSRDHPEMTFMMVNNITQVRLNQQVEECSFLVLRSLMEQIIPINLFLITKSLSVYNTFIESTLKGLEIGSILFLVLVVLISMAACHQMTSINKKVHEHLELFTFFPGSLLDAFIARIASFEAKVIEKQDLTSEIGINKLDTEITLHEDLLPHKRKINKRASIVELAGLTTLLVLVAVGVGFYSLVTKLMTNFRDTSVLEDWFYLSNARSLDLNYVWLQRLIGLDPLKSQPFNLIPVDSLFRNRDYTALHTRNLENIYLGKFTTAFNLEVEEKLNSIFCQPNPSDPSSVSCSSGLSNFSIKSLGSYLQIKQYGLDHFLPQKDTGKWWEFKSVLSLNDRANAKLNEERILNDNKMIIQRELKRMLAHIDLGLLIGLVVLLTLASLFALAYLWQVRRSRESMFMPILILARCFPLRLLNSNQALAGWVQASRELQGDR